MWVGLEALQHLPMILSRLPFCIVKQSDVCNAEWFPLVGNPHLSRWIYTWFVLFSMHVLYIIVIKLNSMQTNNTTMSRKWWFQWSSQLLWRDRMKSEPVTKNVAEVKYANVTVKDLIKSNIFCIQACILYFGFHCI